MAPRATKRRKTETEKFLCSSCDAKKASRYFPDYNPSAECDHLINTCKSCLKKWIEAQVDIGTFAVGPDRDGDIKAFGIKCPECDAVMLNVNVQAAKVNSKIYAAFVERERKYIGDNTPGWRWCMTPGCDAGHVHASKPVDTEEDATNKPAAKAKKRDEAKRNVGKETSAVDIFECDECGGKTCVPCDRPWHKGETCEEYRNRTKGDYKSEDRTLKEIQKVTRKCPQCKKDIQKNGGCSTMSCTQCYVQFCWDCVTEFDNAGHCGCRRPPAPPQPAVQQVASGPEADTELEESQRPRQKA